MTIEEIKTEMKQLKTRIEQLGRELQQAENERKSTEVPETLDWDDGDIYYYSAPYGIMTSLYEDIYNNDEAQNHTIFKSGKFAKIFREKTRFIADLLHFKWLYDRGYEPDWDSNSEKYFVYYDWDKENFEASSIRYWQFTPTVYFSSRDIAQMCADWLNSRNS